MMNKYVMENYCPIQIINTKTNKTKQAIKKQWNLWGKILTEPYQFIQNYVASSSCSKQSLQNTTVFH